MQYRPIDADDIDTVLAIERQVQVSPWTRKIFQDCLKAGYYATVGQQQTQVAAYALMSMAVGEAHILNFAVHPEKQRQGLGRDLLAHLLEVAHAEQTQQIFLEVRASNVAAQALYEQLGFNALAVRQRYYPCPQGREDAIIMARELQL